MQLTFYRWNPDESVTSMLKLKLHRWIKLTKQDYFSAHFPCHHFFYLLLLFILIRMLLLLLGRTSFFFFFFFKFPKIVCFSYIAEIITLDAWVKREISKAYSNTDTSRYKSINPIYANQLVSLINKKECGIFPLMERYLSTNVSPPMRCLETKQLREIP